MNSHPVLIAPSILAADFSRLGAEIEGVERAGADWIHCDIMDGHFVDNISFGPALVATVRKLTKLPLDVHLMIQRADHYVPRFLDAGANSITVHVEPHAEHDVAKTLHLIRDGRCRTGVTLNPSTPFAAVEPYLAEVDLLLIMTVHPGFGGQAFRADQMPKIELARAWRQSHGAKFDIEIDGGINADTAAVSLEHGANVLVAGTSIFKSGEYAAAIRQMRGSSR